jgi:hypothetical protein
MTTKPDRKKRHQALLREVSKLIDQPVDSLAVRLVSLARLKMDVVEAQLLQGDPSVTVADITALKETFNAFIPPPAMEIRVRYQDAIDAAAPDHASISGLRACRRCTWTPSGVDQWPACPTCGWRAGEDITAEWTPFARPVTSPSRGAPLAPQNAPAATTAPTNTVREDAEAEYAAQAAERRRQARISNGVDPGPPRIHTPNIGGLFGDRDTRSISQFQRDVDNAEAQRAEYQGRVAALKAIIAEREGSVFVEGGGNV